MSNSTSLPQDPSDPTPPSLKVFDVDSSFSFGKSTPFQSQDPATLAEVEYTLASIVIDLSGSVFRYVHDLKEALKTLIMSLRNHSRRKFMMIQVLGFQDDRVIDIQGFTQVEQIDVDAVLRQITCNGYTPLYDGIARGLETLEVYATSLSQQSFTANGVLFVLTDGFENNSKRVRNISQIKDAINKLRPADNDPAAKNRCLESLLTLAVGINVDLPDLMTNGGFDSFKEIKDLNANSLAAWGQWASSTIQAQSTALGTGSPSQILSLTI